MASAKTRYTAPAFPLSLQRSLSPTRHSFSTKLFNSSPGISFDLARSVSPKRNLHASSPGRSAPPKAGQRAAVPSGSARKMCLCSPSTHPGSFRCKLHRNCPPSSASSSASTNSQLHMRRSAMKNSLVRIGSVGRRRMDEESSLCAHPALFSPSAKESVVPPAAQQAPPYDHGGRCSRFLRSRPKLTLYITSFARSRKAPPVAAF